MGRLPSAVRREACPSWTHEILDGTELALGLSKPHLRNGFSCRWEVSSHGNGVKRLNYRLNEKPLVGVGRWANECASEKPWWESGDGLLNVPPSLNR